MSKTTRQAMTSRQVMAQVSPAANNWIVAAICVSIAILTWIAFGETLHAGFVNFDDDLYVYENSTVQAGLTASGFVWAFTHVVAGNWHPLTMLTHMLDCQIYGLAPGGHHFTNVLLHTATAILLFLVLRNLTRATWSSAFVAAVFAVHPLRVQSVAWIAERKDVLSGFFFMLTLAAYVRYARKPWSPTRYLPILILFALGLMSKPMLVTLPVVLFLLDYWPLGRLKNPIFDPGHLQRLVLEKIPLLLLALIASLVTLQVQHKAIQLGAEIILSRRLGNAAVSFAIYAGQLFYPANLAAYVPYPANGWPAWEIGLSLVFLIAVSVLVYRLRAKRPYLLVGWFWYLVMLLPVIGIIQVAGQARADRYTYLPLIGLCMGLTWAIAEFSAGWDQRSAVLGFAAGVILLALTAAARIQSTYWLNSESLWLGTLENTSRNGVAESNLANAYLKEQRWDDAATHARAALAIDPDDAFAHNCLGYELFQSKRFDEAIAQFQAALTKRPDFAAAHNNIGLALMENSRPAEAAVQFRAALQLEPDSVEAHNNLGIALLRTGQPAEAVVEYQKSLALDPNFANAANNLAWLLSTCTNASVRDGARALPLARRANQFYQGGSIIVLRTLAASLAESGNYPEAVSTANQALQLATSQSQTNWTKVLRSDLNLYQSHQPLRDSGQGP